MACVDPGEEAEKSIPSMDGSQKAEEGAVEEEEEEDDEDIPDMDGFEEPEDLADNDPVSSSSRANESGRSDGGTDRDCAVWGFCDRPPSLLPTWWPMSRMTTTYCERGRMTSP